MNGAHDLGGMHGLGRDEPVFHDPWEGVIFGTMLATMSQGMHDLDEFGYGIEVMPPNYLRGNRRWPGKGDEAAVGVLDRRTTEEVGRW